MKARPLLPGLSRAILYAFLALAIAFPALATSAVEAASIIVLRSATSANNRAGATSLALPKPSTTVAGDVLIAQVVVSVAGTSITAPSGWHAIRTTSSGSTIKVATYSRVASSSEPASYKWTFGSSQPASGGISDFAGVNRTSPVDVSSGKVNGSTSTASFAQVTTTVANDMLLAVVGVAGNSTVTPPSGFTEAYDRRDLYAKGGRSAEVSRAQKATAGLTSVGSAHEDTLAVTNVTQLIALRPAGATASSTPTRTPTPTATPDPVVIAVVGDMECITATCQSTGVPGLVSSIHPNMFFPDGDLVWIGAYANFVNYYDPAFGQFKSISHPSIGNHDGLKGYYDYWDGIGSSSGRAGPRAEGWYSFTRGAWHIVVLNSNCVTSTPQVSCAPGSPQITWLAHDLAAHPSLCTAAFMHIPYYTSGVTQYPQLQTIFQTLYNYHVDLLLTGHTHYYQRYYPQNANGQRVANGVTEIVVGTGGGDLAYVQNVPKAPNEAVQIGQAFGVLKMTLNASSYSFQWMPAPGYSGSDSGSGNCH